jgi:glutaconyl-CoA decarboxylase
MNGTIAKINCKVGDAVTADTAVIILEAMKMENEIFAGVSGTVSEIRTSVGATVQPGDVLVVIG